MKWQPLYTGGLKDLSEEKTFGLRSKDVRRLLT